MCSSSISVVVILDAGTARSQSSAYLKMRLHLLIGLKPEKAMTKSVWAKPRTLDNTCNRNNKNNNNNININNINNNNKIIIIIAIMIITHTVAIVNLQCLMTLGIYGVPGYRRS